MVEASKEHNAPEIPAQKLSILRGSRPAFLDVKLGALAVTLAGVFSVAGFMSTYVSFSAASTDPGVFISRAATTNSIAAAILAFVCVYIAGLALARRIASRLERFNVATRQAASGTSLASIRMRFTK